MKVLHIINDLNIGGGQKMVHDLALLQNKSSSIQVKICTLNTTESELVTDLREANIDVTSLSATRGNISTVKKLVKEMKWADVVHVHLFPSNYLVALANIFTSKPLLFTEHSTHNRRRNHKILRPLERLVYSRYHRVSCISTATKINLRSWIGSRIADPRLVVIENGIEIEKYKNATSYNSQAIFGRSGIPLLMISRLSPAKDHPTVIKALKYIDNQNVFVVFVGDGERRNELETLAKELEVENRVVFLGTRNDIPELIKSSKIGIQSSLWEGFGLTAVEIMAGGIPLIASEVEGLKEVVEGAGIFFPPSDDKVLAQKIQYLLDNPSSYEKCVKDGIKKALNYSIAASAKKFEELYNEIIH